MAVGVAVAVGAAVAVAVAVAVGVNLGVAVAVAVGVGVNVAVEVGVNVAVAVAVGVRVGVGVGDRLGVRVAVGVGDGLGVRVAVGVGLGVGLRCLVGASDAWLELCLPVSVTERTPWGTWGKVFPGIASSPAAQSRMPSEAGVLKGRIPDCFWCAIETRELKNANAEADFFFIWGYLSCRSPLREKEKIRQDFS